MPSKKGVQWDWRVLVVGLLVGAAIVSSAYFVSRAPAPAPVVVSSQAAVANFGTTTNDLLQQASQSGRMWEQSYYTTSIASTGVFTFLVVTDLTTATTPYKTHIVFRPTATDTFLVELFAVSPITLASDMGVTQTLVNYNRVYSAVAPRARVFLGPTDGFSMTMNSVSSILVPAEAILPTQEWALSPTAKYAVKITNISPGTMDIGWRMQLYESQ